MDDPPPNEGGKFNGISRWLGRKKKTLKKGSSSTQPALNVNEDQEVEQLEFLGPYDPNDHPTLCSLPETHVSRNIIENESYVHQWKVRCAKKSVMSWWAQLKKMEHESFERVRGMILASPFGPLLTFDWGKNDQALEFALAERWWDTTHTFHFPWGEASITPLDFTMLTGLSVGLGTVVPFDESIESIDHAREYFPSLEVPENNRIQRSDFRSGGLRCQWLFERYCGYLRERNVRLYGISDNTICEHVRAFLFYLIGQLFFKTGDSYIRLGWLRGVLDLSVMDQFDWGGAILAHLYLGLDLAVRHEKGGSLTGFVVILPVCFNCF